MAALLHVDVIHDHQAADITEPDLPRNFYGRFHVHLEDGVFFVTKARFMGARVNVDGDQGLRFIDDDFTARRQGHTALEGLFDLALDVVAFEDGDGLFVIGDLAAGAGGDLRDKFLGALVVSLVVNQHAIDVLSEEITHGALNDIRLLIKAGGRAIVFHLLHDLLPFGEKQVEIADKVTRLLAFARGPDDDPHALRDGQFIDESFEAFTLLGVLNFTRNPAAVGERGEDQVATRQGEIGRGPRAFGPNGAFGDLDNNIRARWVHARDVLDRGQCGALAPRVFFLINADDLN